MPAHRGCVLLQEVHNEMHPVAYVSRSLTDVAKGYAQIECEALAVLYGLKKMHTYIHSHHVTACSNRPQATLGCVSQIVTVDLSGENCIASSRPHDLNPIYEPGNRNIADDFAD